MDDEADLPLDTPEAPRINTLDKLQGFERPLEKLCRSGTAEAETVDSDAFVLALAGKLESESFKSSEWDRDV